MTRITFHLSQNGQIAAVDLSGHAGYAEEGEDIVCAAVSSAVQLTHALLFDVQKIPVDALIEEDGAHIRLTLPAQMLDKGQDAMRALRIFYTELASQYPDFLCIAQPVNV